MYMYIIRMVSSNSPSLRIFVVSCMVSRNSHHSNISRQKIETHHLGPGLIKIYMWKHHYCWSLMLHHNQNQQLHPLKLTCCHLKMEDDSRREVHQVHPLPHERSGTQKKHMVSKDMNLKKNKGQLRHSQLEGFLQLKLISCQCCHLSTNKMTSEEWLKWQNLLPYIPLYRYPYV